MKRLLHTTLFLLATTIAALAGSPAIQFDEMSHDFGNISEKGGPVTYEFTFTNTGDEPLVIVSVNTSCGCTRPEFPKKPIKPGQSDKIKVTYLPDGRPGEFNKTVRVRTNASRPKNVSLKINGVVIPATE